MAYLHIGVELAVPSRYVIVEDVALAMEEVERGEQLQCEGHNHGGGEGRAGEEPHLQVAVGREGVHDLPGGEGTFSLSFLLIFEIN